MLIRSAEQDIERVLYTEKAIAARVEEIGTELTKKLGDKRPVLVCVLKGASFFYIDLCRCMNCAIDMDFIAVSSYGASAQSTGVVRLIKDLDNNITGRHVVIVEDIIDSGLTMQYLRQLFGGQVRAVLLGEDRRGVGPLLGQLGDDLQHVGVGQFGDFRSRRLGFDDVFLGIAQCAQTHGILGLHGLHDPFRNLLFE